MPCVLKNNRLIVSVLQGDKLFDGYKGGLTKILAAFAR